MGHKRTGGVPHGHQAGESLRLTGLGVVFDQTSQSWSAFIPTETLTDSEPTFEVAASHSGLGSPETHPAEWIDTGVNTGASELGLWIVNSFSGIAGFDYARARIRQNGQWSAWSQIGVRQWTVPLSATHIGWQWPGSSPTSFAIWRKTTENGTPVLLDTLAGSARSYAPDGDSGWFQVRAISSSEDDLYASSPFVQFDVEAHQVEGMNILEWSTANREPLTWRVEFGEGGSGIFDQSFTVAGNVLSTDEVYGGDMRVTPTYEEGIGMTSNVVTVSYV